MREWQVTTKYAYTFDSTKSEWADSRPSFMNCPYHAHNDFLEAHGMATERALIPILKALLRTHGTRIADATYASFPPGAERYCHA